MITLTAKCSFIYIINIELLHFTLKTLHMNCDIQEQKSPGHKIRTESNTDSEEDSMLTSLEFTISMFPRKCFRYPCIATLALSETLCWPPSVGRRIGKAALDGTFLPDQTFRTAIAIARALAF